MPGSTTFVNRCQPLVPSSSAASSCSAGMPLMDAESTTTANPVCTQIITMMSRIVFIGAVCSQSTGS